MVVVVAPVGAVIVATVQVFLHPAFKGEKTPLPHVTLSQTLPARVQVQTVVSLTFLPAAHRSVPSVVPAPPIAAVPVAIPFATVGLLAAVKTSSTAQCDLHCTAVSLHTPLVHVVDGFGQV